MAVTTGGLTVTMSTYFSKVFLEKSRLIIRHDAFAQKRGVPANQGKIVNFTRHIQPAVATTGLTESTTPTAINVSGQQIAVTLVEYGAYEQISKFYERTSIDVGLKEQVEAMGINMGESIDTIIKNVLIGGLSTAIYAGTAASTSSTSVASVLASTDIRKAVRTLKKLKAIPFQGTQGNPVFGSLIGPESAYDLYQTRRSINLANSANTPRGQRRAKPNIVRKCVENIYETLTRVDDMFRPIWRHIELPRNVVAVH